MINFVSTIQHIIAQINDLNTNSSRTSFLRKFVGTPELKTN